MMFRQAIRVKYLPPSYTKGSRYKAVCPAKSITRSREYEFNSDDDACRVAKELATMLGWCGNWYGGQLDNGDFVFVMAENSKLSSDGFYVDEAHRPTCKPASKKPKKRKAD